VPVASPVFSAGSYLAAQGVPTFGYNINPAQWDTGPAMFGHNGSYLNPAGIDVAGPFLATNLGVTRVAVLGYSVTQSAQCVRGQAKSFAKFGFQVVLTDASLPLGVPSVAPEIAKVQSSGAQLAVLCMDPTGDEKISEGLHQAGLSNVAQFWINGYDEASLAQYRRQYEGVYLAVAYVPFEEASRSPGLTRFLAEMHRHFPSEPVGEVALAGWISADMFVTGLRRAGPHLTRRRLVDAVNSLTDFTAGGIEPPVDWRVDHTSPGPVNCSSFVQVRNGRFTPIFHQPFTCLPQNAATRAELHNLPNVAGVR
ncbi:MAG TPA: ABC transporter substrate-binding protein, partial [Acidimicrobiales bacterium]|nr:ABC transporter substrate-binding protein [Acidimicrobiales bacterium]